MNFIVDADTIFDFFKGKSELFHFFDDTENIFVSCVTVGELNYRARIEQSEKNIMEIANDFVHLLHIVNIDEQIALEYGKLKVDYPSLQDNKLWLCATAIVKNFVLITNDEEYINITELVTKRV